MHYARCTLHVLCISGVIRQALAAGLAAPVAPALPSTADSLPPMTPMPAVPSYAHAVATLGEPWGEDVLRPPAPPAALPAYEEAGEEGSALDRELSLIDGEIAHLQQALETATEQHEEHAQTDPSRGDGR